MLRTGTRTISESSNLISESLHLNAGVTREVMRTNTHCLRRKTSKASLGTFAARGVPRWNGRCTEPGRLVFYCRTTRASTAPCASKRMCCPTHCASYCAPSAVLASIFRMDSIATRSLSVPRYMSVLHTRYSPPSKTAPCPPYSAVASEWLQKRRPRG